MPFVRRTNKVLVSDFDGTMTDIDFYELVLAHFPWKEQPDPWQRYLQGEISHFEAMRAIFATLPADEAAVAAIAAEARLDPRLGDAYAQLLDAGWEVVVVSAGCDWYVRRLLAGEGLEPPIIANPGRILPGKGLAMERPEGSPYYAPTTGIDKVKVVETALAYYPVVAFAGDGRPDLAAALRVPPRRRLARGWLAGALNERQEEFRPFRRWAEIPELLVDEG